MPNTLHRTEQSIKRSLFITSTAHAPHADAARAFVECIKSTFSDATHNCWAYVAGPPGDTAHVGLSDDGEPHGTAGRPMLTILLHSGIGELVCVVTRYFGGIKLGTGGLVRAYQGAVLENLQSLPIQQRIIPTHIHIIVPYNHINTVHRLLPRFAATITQEYFTTHADFTICLPQEQKDFFITALINASDGTAIITD